MSEDWKERTTLTPREILDRAADFLGVGAPEGALVRRDHGGSFRLVVRRGFYSSWAWLQVSAARGIGILLGAAGGAVVTVFTLGLGWMGRRWAREDRLRPRGMAADLTRP